MPAPLKVDWPAIRLAAVAARLSYKELADQFGIDEATIRQRAKREGWTVTEQCHGTAAGNLVRRATGQEIGIRPSDTVSSAVSRAVTDAWAQRREESQEAWHRITERGRGAIERMDDDEIIMVVDKAGKLFDMERKNLGLDKDQGNQVNVVVGVLNEMFNEDVEGEFSPRESLEAEVVDPVTEAESVQCDGLECR